MKLSNYLIVEQVNYLKSLTDLSIYIPIQANFFIQKNIIVLTQIAKQIEDMQFHVIQHYGVLNKEKQQYIIPQEKIEIVQKELEELFNIEQDLDIKMIKLEDLGDIQLTPAQMQALMFMIED